MNNLSEALHIKLLTQKKTLALAESCTGGLIAHRLTQQAGASGYFLGGIVCYSNASKVDLLGVDPHMLEKEGAVSEAVAWQLAEGALRLFHSDYSLAITGIAGPSGGSPEKPVGMAWLAIGQKGAPTLAWKLLAPPQERGLMMAYFADALLSKLISRL